MIKKIINSIIRRIKYSRERTYKVGQFYITLPPGHLLDLYQENFKNYDSKLPIIARLIEEKYKYISIIDIGANIGDTAAALRTHTNSPIICIEGNPEYLPLLRSNCSNLPGTIQIVPKFIGLDFCESVGNLITKNGTAYLERYDSNDSAYLDSTHIETVTFGEIMNEFSSLPDVRLVKIDTDGFDFKIILCSIKDLKEIRPIIFFEFDPSFSPKDKKNEWLFAVNALIEADYLRFVVYDNFGNYMFSFSENIVEIFTDLNSFLMQSLAGGNSVKYFDICCFSECDSDVFKRLVEFERGFS